MDQDVPIDTDAARGGSTVSAGITDLDIKPADAAPTDLPSIMEEKYNPDKLVGEVRSYIAIGAICILAGVVLGGFVMAAWALGTNATIKDNRETVVVVLNILLPPITTLVGSVTGFYFGVQSAERRGR